MRPISASGWRIVVSAGSTMPGFLEIVEADDREVLGNADAARARGAHRADRHVVVEGEDRRRRLGEVEQPVSPPRRRRASSKFDSTSSSGSGSDARLRECRVVAASPVVGRLDAARAR